jgi:uncharacterized protein YecE (DUF72 family)
MLFGHPGEAFRQRLTAPLKALAARGVYVGTSSWKYEGWIGQLYDRENYVYRRKFSRQRFEENCLREYAEVFKSVCVDGAYYQFPTEEYLGGLCAQVQEDFRFSLKVTDDITLNTFPNIDRFGSRAGQTNREYLNAELFVSRFLRPCEPFKAKLGVLMFEFSRFESSDYLNGSEFAADLDAFFVQLPKGWNFGVEMRNKDFLVPDYFAVLRKHGVAHVFNSWTHMPPVDEQIAMEGTQTSDAFLAARFLLRPGRTYEQAVAAFKPYSETKDPFKEARDAALSLILLALARDKQALVYINNRLEGDALSTIRALVEALAEIAGPPVPEAAPPSSKTPLLPGLRIVSRREGQDGDGVYRGRGRKKLTRF